MLIFFPDFLFTAAYNTWNLDAWNAPIEGPPVFLYLPLNISESDKPVS